MSIKVQVTAPMGATLRPPVLIINPTKAQLANRGHSLVETRLESGIYKIVDQVNFKRGEIIEIEGDPGSSALTEIADAVTGATGPALRAEVKAAAKSPKKNEPKK